MNDYILKILPNHNDVKPVYDDDYVMLSLFPRINNNPLRFYYKKQNKILSERCYVSIKLLEFILKGDDSNDKNKLIALKYLFEEDDFLKVIGKQNM